MEMKEESLQTIVANLMSTISSAWAWAEDNLSSSERDEISGLKNALRRYKKFLENKRKNTMKTTDSSWHSKPLFKEEDGDADKKARDGIKAVISTDWGGSNAEQYKNIQIMSGLAGSDSAVANKFLKKINDFTSQLKIEDF